MFTHPLKGKRFGGLYECPEWEENCQSPYFIHTLFALFAYSLTKSSHSHSPYSPLHLCFLLLSPAQHSIIMLIPSLPSFSPLQPEECQEYLQNSTLFSQFLLILLTNIVLTISFFYLFHFLTNSDHQRQQETYAIGLTCSTAGAFTLFNYRNSKLSSYSRPKSVLPSQNTSGDSTLSTPVNLPSI